MALFPTALDSFTTKVDGQDDILAAHMNAVQSAIVAIETELGTLPKGSAADLKTRLAVSLNNNGTLIGAQVLASSVPLATKPYSIPIPTVPTTGSIVVPVIAPVTGVLAAVIWGSESGLATHASNYITWAIRNYGLAAAGTAQMLGAAATTNSVGGSAITARVPRTLTLTGTPADLAVVQGDYLLLTITITGTLGGTLVNNALGLRFTHTA